MMDVANKLATDGLLVLFERCLLPLGNGRLYAGRPTFRTPKKESKKEILELYMVYIHLFTTIHVDGRFMRDLSS